MRSKVVALALFAGLLGTLLVAGPALSKTKSLEVDDNYFVHKGGRPTVTVDRGDTVRWVWTGKNIHNVTVSGGLGCHTPSRYHRGQPASLTGLVVYDKNFYGLIQK